MSSISTKSKYHHLGDIQRIVEAGLCTRCGACAVCPFDAIQWGDYYYPIIDRSKCTDCGICMAVCPGEELNIPQLAKELYGNDADVEHPLGTIRRSYIGYAASPRIRSMGAGGGIVTQLLIHLLENGEIDGAILVGGDPKRPWRSKPVIATTSEEIESCSGSRYTIVPTLMTLPELKNYQGKFALVCLPCQTHGYHLIKKVMPRLASRISVIIGLFCWTNWEIDATVSVISSLGVELEAVNSFEYRGGKWPGGLRVKIRDGKIREIPLLIVNYLRYMYVPQRCTSCVDMSSEFSDIAVGDAWFRAKDGCFAFEGCSTILARTRRGLDIIERARKEHIIEVSEASEYVYGRQFQSAYTRKKLIAYQRTWTPEGLSPNYHMSVEEVSGRQKAIVKNFNIALRVAQCQLIRRLAVPFLVSPLGIRMMELVEVRKRVKKLDVSTLKLLMRVFLFGVSANE